MSARPWWRRRRLLRLFERNGLLSPDAAENMRQRQHRGDGSLETSVAVEGGPLIEPIGASHDAGASIPSVCHPRRVDFAHSHQVTAVCRLEYDAARATPVTRRPNGSLEFLSVRPAAPGLCERLG